MYCANCGKELSEKEQFCPSCGEKVNKDVISAFDYPSNNEKKPEKVKSRYYVATLVLGILSVIFSLLNYLGVIFVHMVGIVLGIIAISLASNDKKMGRIYSVPG